MKTETRVVAGLTGAAVLAGCLAVGSLATAQPPEVPSVSLEVASTGDSVTIQFVGDTMLGEGAQGLIDARGYGALFEQVAPLLHGDVLVANVASAISTQSVGPSSPKLYDYAMVPAAAAALSQAGIDVLQLSNNNAMDRGAAGLVDTLASAQEAGLAAYGAGLTLAQAEAPLIVKTSVGTIAVVGLGENFGVASTATATAPGIPVLSRSQVERSAALARAAGADWIVATVHWGDNYQPVNIQQERYAAMFAGAGYDAVIGTGSHTAQRIDVIGGTTVVNGIGNFVFGAPGRYAKYGVEGRGLMTSLTFDRSGIASMELRCIQTDNKKVGYRPAPCTPEESVALFQELNPAISTGADAVGRLELSARQ